MAADDAALPAQLTSDAPAALGDAGAAGQTADAARSEPEAPAPEEVGAEDEGHEVLKVHLKEKQSQRYLYVEPNTNTCHIVIPFGGGDLVGTDNTCQAALEMQKFLGRRNDSATVKNSAIHELERYLSALDFDAWLLELASQRDPALAEARRLKGQRISQILMYKESIQHFANDDDTRTALAGPFPEYPAAVLQAIREATNLQVILLCPLELDNYTRYPNPTFQVRRGYNEASAPFRFKLHSKLREQMPQAELDFATVAFCGGGCCASDAPSEASFQTMLGNVAANMESHGRALAPWTYPTLASYTDTFMMDFDNMGEVLEAVVSAEGLELPDGVSFFKQARDAESLCLMVQVFLGMVAIHLAAVYNIAENFGDALDNEAQNATDSVNSVHQALMQEDPEAALLDFALRCFGHVDLLDGATEPVWSTVVPLIKDRFAAVWRTIQDAPHHDEFLVFVPDVHDARATGLNHQGCIGVHFAQILLCFAQLKDGDVDAGMYPNELSELRGTFDRARHNEGLAVAQALPHNNPHVAHPPVELSVGALRHALELEASRDKVAHLLLAEYDTEDGPKPLYDKLLEGGAINRADWQQVRAMLVDMMPDQETMNRFSAFLDGVTRYFRITGYIARSIYQEAQARDRSAPDALDALSNETAPDKLHRALLYCQIDIEKEHITMSDTYDGYVVECLPDVSERILSIHKRRRTNFLLTKEKTRLVYEAVKRRFGEDSTEYLHMNELYNDDLENLPNDPHNPLRGRCWAPPKIFTAFRLMGIVVRGWSWGGTSDFDGYELYSDNPVVIDDVERLIQWSQHQKEIEEGARNPGQVTRRRGMAEE